ncbi:hypothetical protein [Candidatus Poriferisocius sp.]|uniref:hypothetical protein n=1 Tax=Candidatus Poriferisocius sp. TaxID=3101276 RepID=UPI003B0182C2
MLDYGSKFCSARYRRLLAVISTRWLLDFGPKFCSMLAGQPTEAGEQQCPEQQGPSHATKYHGQLLRVFGLRLAPPGAALASRVDRKRQCCGSRYGGQHGENTPHPTPEALPRVGSPDKLVAIRHGDAIHLYTVVVKVAVSIPDPVFEAAEALAARRKCSRSSLYAQALENLLAAADDHDDDVTARLDAVYTDVPSRLDDILSKAQAQVLDEPW